MLDAGLEVEPERARIVREMGATEPSEWPAGHVAQIKEGMDGSGERIPLKLAFGSDYAYREAGEHTPWRSNGAAIRPSLALGGLSTVWGAAMLPFRDADLEGWPVKSAQLARHYREVLDFMDLAGARDDLDGHFPLYCENPGALAASGQAGALLKKLERHRERLRREGWCFGRARVAVRAADSRRGRGCLRCRMCLYGCPYGCIYNSADTVAEMLVGRGFSYRKDVIVTRLREGAGKVSISGYDRRTGEPLGFEAERVYLAAGIVPTTQILLRSQGAYDRPVQAHDSQYYMFPLFTARRLKGAQTEAAYTLSQLFIEMFEPRGVPHAVHLQIYSCNEIIAQAVRRSLGWFGCFAGAVAERTLIAQGYLHSEDSPKIEMTLRREGAKDYLELDVVANPRSKEFVQRVMREFGRQARQLGAMPLASMLQLASPGQGFHSGGTFPMREQPKEFESDCLGRPRGWSRVHAVDATVFPSVPATTITFPVMANAHRIGWEAASNDLPA